MKKRIIYLAAIFAVIFSSCTIGRSKTNEAEVIPETGDTETASASFIESGSVLETTTEAVPPEEISETTAETTPVFTGETTSEQKAFTADVYEETSVTEESVPSYDDISLYAANIQGDWVYDSEYNDNWEAKIYRRNIIDGSVEDITGYSFYSAKNICVSGEYIFFIEDLYDYSGRIIRINITDKSTEVLREFISDNGFGCYMIDDMAVYENNIFFVTYGYWSETDEPKYDLYTIDINGNDVGADVGYKEAYSPIYFLNDDNDFYIVWRDEEIAGADPDNDYTLTSAYTDKCYVYDAAAGKRYTVRVPPETSDDDYTFLKCDGEFLYIEINDRNSGNIINTIKAGTDGYEYIG